MCQIKYVRKFTQRQVLVHVNARLQVRLCNNNKNKEKATPGSKLSPAICLVALFYEKIIKMLIILKNIRHTNFLLDFYSQYKNGKKVGIIRLD